MPFTCYINIAFTREGNTSMKPKYLERLLLTTMHEHLYLLPWFGITCIEQFLTTPMTLW